MVFISTAPPKTSSHPLPRHQNPPDDCTSCDLPRSRSSLSAPEENYDEQMCIPHQFKRLSQKGTLWNSKQLVDDLLRSIKTLVF